MFLQDTGVIVITDYILTTVAYIYVKFNWCCSRMEHVSGLMLFGYDKAM